MEKSVVVTPSFIEYLRQQVTEYGLPMSHIIIQEYGKDPFLILISCLISLRARDTTTIHVCRELFAHARTPEEICEMKDAVLEKILYKSGFYQRKAAVLKAVSAQILKAYGGRVPCTEQELMSLPGVGIKTTNLVLSLAFDIPAICVDTHVHRLSNQWGLVHTKTAEETEKALKKVVPREYWIEWNQLLVMIGQNQGRSRTRLPRI